MLIIAHAGGIHHPLGRLNCGGIGILIVKVNHRLDARLYDRLGAFVARKQRHIQLAAFQAAPAVIQDRIEFTVSGIEVFIIVGILFSFAPWELVIGTALGNPL